VKFVHAADLHIDSPLRGLDRYDGAPVDRLRGATRRAMTNLVDLALAESAAFVLIAGDVFDGGWKDYGTGLFFASEMARLRAADIPVVLVRGNHDAASHITRSLRLPDNVRELSHAKPESFEIARAGVVVHGQSFATRAMTDDLAARYPDAVPGAFNVGLLHTCADGREGHEPYAPCKIETLRSKGYDYWALGHVHAREVLSEDPWIVFPGNLQGRHARETGPKGATVVTVEGGRVRAVEHRALDVVRWAVCEVDVAGAHEPMDVVELARGALEKEVEVAAGRLLAARLVFRGRTRAHTDIAVDTEKWVNELRAMSLEVEGAAWIEKVVFATAAAIDLQALRAQGGAIGEILRAIDEAARDEAEVRSLGEALKDLRGKLPAELREGDDALALDDPARLRALLADAEDLLVPRLLDRRAPGEEG
jgi:DNA repair exonuclease SbcCD nuclease subunit